MTDTSKTVELGDRVRDMVTQAEGVVIGLTEWLTGCDQAVVSRGMDDKGAMRDSAYFDVTRLTILEKAAVVIPSAGKEPGGPTARY